MPQDTGAQAAQPDDAVSRVLRSNAGQFEKTEILHAGLVGILIGAINFILDLMLMSRAEDVYWYQYVTLAYGLMLVVLGGLVLRRSLRANAVMFGMLMAGVLVTLLSSILGEQLSVMGIVAAIIWGLIVWFKVFPAFDSIKVLTAGDAKPMAPVGSMLETVIVGLGGLVLLVRLYFDLSALFL